MCGCCGSGGCGAAKVACVGDLVLGVVVFIHEPRELDGGIAGGEGTVLAGRVAIGVDARTIDTEISADVSEEGAEVVGREIGVGSTAESRGHTVAQTFVGSGRKRCSCHPYRCVCGGAGGRSEIGRASCRERV